MFEVLPGGKAEALQAYIPWLPLTMAKRHFAFTTPREIHLIRLRLHFWDCMPLATKMTSVIKPMLSVKVFSYSFFTAFVPASQILIVSLL